MGFGPLLACDPGGDLTGQPTDDDEHGTVMIELQRSAQEPMSPFIGTEFIVAFLDYGECLTDFYANEHPEYAQEGTEGEPIFEAWANDELCDPARYASNRPIVPCQVADFTQIVGSQGLQDTYRLAVTYEIEDDAIEGLYVPYGPLPGQPLAGCTPVVTLTGASVQGRDAAMNVVWQIASFENPTARVGQGAAIQIFVERP